MNTIPQLLKVLKKMKNFSRLDLNMLQSEMESKSTTSENKLEVIGYDDKDTSDTCFIVKSPMEHILKISDTFAEMFSMWAGRILITAENEKWAFTAAKTATGLATSIIMSPAEAGIESIVPPEKTLDEKNGIIIQIYHHTRKELKTQMILRIGQCIMTCPTTSAFDALPEAKRRLKVGKKTSFIRRRFPKTRCICRTKSLAYPSDGRRIHGRRQVRRH